MKNTISGSGGKQDCGRLRVMLLHHGKKLVTLRNSLAHHLQFNDLMEKSRHRKQKSGNRKSLQQSKSVILRPDWMKDVDSPRAWSDTDLGNGRQQYEEEEPWEPPEEEATEQPAGPQTAAEAVAEAVSRSSHRELRQDCPGYMINKKLANCREVQNDTELKCIGLLNFLMRKHGYAYMTNKQLAIWLRMKNPESARHLLARLCKRGLLENTGSRHGEMRWVVREDLQDPKRRRS
jgi:hypothetical protein